MKAIRRAPMRGGFTLIELLVVIGIIVVLISILLPVVGQVRTVAHVASTQAQMSRISAACQAYYHDFNAYPGPVANVYLSGGSQAGQDKSPAAITGVTGTITSSENLVLGLIGMLTPPPPPPASGGVMYIAPGQQSVAGASSPHDVVSLNPLHPTSYHYMDFLPDELSTGSDSHGDGHFGGPQSALEYAKSQSPTDSTVPEFVDKIPDPMPILYVRANAGNPGIASADDTTQYNDAELGAYGSYATVTGSSPAWFPFTEATFKSWNASAASPSPLSNSADPYWDFAPPDLVTAGSYYFLNPNVVGSPRAKDTFILISAGKDRTYGTQDDIIVTP